MSVRGYRLLRSRRFEALVVVFSMASLSAGAHATPDADTLLTRDTIAVDLDQPIFLTTPKGDTNRLFVVELPGSIRIIKNGVLLPDPFLDITAQTCDNPENGLLGLAFHPDYATNGYFYVQYNDNDCNLVVSRFTRSLTSGDSSDAGSEFTILTIDQPDFPDHNGGTIAFGPDGMLYIPTGDGRCCGDPFANAQNTNVLLGKLLRIDVDTGSPYAIPADNPFLGSGSVLNEIVGVGLRNPYRCSFDRLTGDLYLADVGQNLWEEVSFVDSSGLVSARNFGWPTLEGTNCYEPPSGCDATGLQLPIHEYEHLGQCSITGGFVYRGCAITELQGRYIFGDFCTGQIWSLSHNGVSVVDLIEHTDEIGSDGLTLTGFGEDANGEMYICTILGAVIRIVPYAPPVACPDVCSCDCNADPAGCNGAQDVTDVVQVVNVAFRSAASIPDPDGSCPYATTDVNCSNSTDVIDVVRMVNVAFRGLSASSEFCTPCL